MKIALLSLLLVSSLSSAAEEFNIEAPFKNAAKVPVSLVRHLISEMSVAEKESCAAVPQDGLFEAQSIALNNVAKAYLVKPAHRCLCAQQACPAWLYRVSGKTSKQLWHVPSTGQVDIQDKKFSGYRALRESSQSVTEGHETVWAWNRTHYEEIYRNDWVWNEQQQCRLGKETTQLMDGHMVQHTKKCLQNDAVAQ